MRKVKFSVRLATRADMNILISHRQKMWQEITPRMSRRIIASQKSYRDWLARMMKERRFTGIVAFVGERQGRVIIGSGGIWLHEIHPMPWLDGENEPYILSMYTEKEFRGLGVARRIMKEAMKWCRKKGYRSARLNASKMGRGLYSSLGWKRTWEMRKKL